LADQAPLGAMRLGIGLAALGRPGYITLDHDAAFGGDRSVAAMRDRTARVLDAAYAAGIRHVDAARSYGHAETFLREWLQGRPAYDDVVVSSKWGHTYVADWQVHADRHEVKDHSVAAFRRQWPETRALLGDRVRLYQVHSVTPESTVLGDRELLGELGRLREQGVQVGLSTSGAHQLPVVRAALEVEVDGVALFSSVQATWNLMEPSVGPALADAAAAGWRVIVKEVLANGRLAGVTAPEQLRAAASRAGTSADALAVAAALALPASPTVLLGAVTVDQLAGNLGALDVDPAVVANDARGLDRLAEPADVYWKERSALVWH
jgi:aryl-alcohol dehydrogenase-like predicted oxidoreductase